MLKAGLATVYEASEGAEFGGLEVKYRQAEEKAKKKRKGMWAGNPKDYESPRDYKIRTAGMNEPKQDVITTTKFWRKFPWWR